MADLDLRLSSSLSEDTVWQIAPDCHDVSSASHHPGLVLSVLLEDGDALSFDLPPSGRVIIGRAEDAGIVVSDPSISRKHAVLHLGTSISLEDLGSENGTRLLAWRREVADDPQATERTDAREERVPPGRPVPVAIGQVMKMGAALVVVQRSGSPRARPSAPPATKADAKPIVVDPAMLRLHEFAVRVALGTLPVLLLGETGVGKEIFAETIHAHSPRAQKPLLRLNCGALSETLLESELFGHERGAFTGATQSKTGLLEAATGGSVFLDEIGELSPKLQVKLLRVMEDNAVLRVGATRPRDIDVRFIAATNRDLELEIPAGRFREDLYFRINGACLRIPPLRERPSEIPHLARRFLGAAAGRARLDHTPGLRPEAEAWLVAHAWPGNARELRNAMERAVLLSGGAPIGLEHLPTEGARKRQPSAAESPTPERLREMLDNADRDRIVRVLESCAGNQSKAAKILGISRGTLLTRMDAYNLPRPRKRSE